MRLGPNSLLYCKPYNYTELLQSCATHLHRHLRPLHMQFSAQHAMYMHCKTVIHLLCCCVQSFCCRRYIHFSAQHAMYMYYKTVIHPFFCCVQSVCCRRYGDTMLVAMLSKMSWCIMRRMTRCMCTLQSHATRKFSAFTLVSFSTCHSVTYFIKYRAAVCTAFLAVVLHMVCL